MEGSGLLIDIHKGSGGEGTKDNTLGGKHVRLAERRQDSKTRDAGSIKKTCVSKTLLVYKGLHDLLQSFNIDIAESSLIKSPYSWFCPLSIFSGLSVMLWC